LGEFVLGIETLQSSSMSQPIGFPPLRSVEVETIITLTARSVSICNFLARTP